jgi:YggT family protein
VIEILIAIRIVLKLLAANPAAEFTGFIYALTDIFIAPFQGVFPNPVGDGTVLELSAILAIPIYMLLARLCMSIVNIVRGRYPTPHP